MSEERLNDELTAIEAALGNLTPVASSVQRDRVMFLAGRAMAGRATPPCRRRWAAWLWPCATSASLLAAAVFGVLWSTSNRSTIVERVVYVQAARSSAPLQASAAKPSSSSFAKWQLAPATRKKATDAVPQRGATPSQRVPRNSDSGNRSHTTESVT
jgi:hypothetical protein